MIHFPNIYGTDGFQVIWMANALRNGALISKNSWLINLASYFGYYPFSHRAIGVPMVLAILISIFTYFPLGFFSINAAVLCLDILFIIFVYKSAKSLGNTLFREEWKRFLFTAAILFSQIILNDVVMNVSTRIVITITMMIILNLNIKIIKNRMQINKTRMFLSFFLLLLIGALSHRLWVGTIIPILFMVFVFLIQKHEKFIKISLFVILILIPIAFFLGLGIFGDTWISEVDSNQIITPFIDSNSILGIWILLSWFYTYSINLITIFFPIGVIGIFYSLIIGLKNSKKSQKLIENRKFFQKYYLILFLIPFSFMASTTFYSIVLFFPIIIIFSIYGINFIRHYISNYYKYTNWLVLGVLFSISILYSFIKINISPNVNIWYIYFFSIILIVLVLSAFIIKKYNIRSLFGFHINRQKLKNGLWVSGFIISILIFSITTIESNRVNLQKSPYPWNERFLTNEEIEIINFFQHTEINGLIFSTDNYISLKVGGVGFLPIFTTTSLIGLALWYGLVTQKEVIENTKFQFSFYNIIDQDFFSYSPKNATSYVEKLPLRVLMMKIINLNMTYTQDRKILRFDYNIQYLITMKQCFNHTSNEWILVQSLRQSNLKPVFSTLHINIWRIF
ncbi:MAG: hypothetical protein P8Y97_15380 [Candidatus Lokiarchaeota archaeon]